MPSSNKHTIMRIPIRKSVSCQVYKHPVTSSSSESSGSSSSSENLDTPLKRFNRILRSSVARHWSYFRRERPSLVRSRGRSISDAGLCSLIDSDLELWYVARPSVPARRSLYVFGTQPAHLLAVPPFSFTSAGAGSAAQGVDEASDSDVERPRRGHHLRVPTPALPGQSRSPTAATRPRVHWSFRRDSLPAFVGLKEAWLKRKQSLLPDQFFDRRRSTGNFCASSGGGGGGAPRSAPATPLQLHPSQPGDTHARTKHDKHAVKPLSGSAPSVRVSALTAASDSTEGSKPPSKARQKKFQRHFPQVGPEERVLNYYSCALVGDLLLQGHLYITKNYFAFYSNVFGYVTKLLIPITSVLRITKEKVARIIPNAVGVCTRDERHVFGSLLSRDATYKLMTHVWKVARGPELAAPKPSQELRASEVELDASEYSPEDDSSSGGAEPGPLPPPQVKREPDAIISTAGAAVIQPALLTGGVGPGVSPAGLGAGGRAGQGLRGAMVLLAALLAATATLLAYRLYTRTHSEEELLTLSGEELYSELLRWRSRLHGRAASELHAFLSTNLLLLTKVRQSLEVLSGVILKDMAAGDPPYVIDPPNDTVFS